MQPPDRLAVTFDHCHYPLRQVLTRGGTHVLRAVQGKRVELPPGIDVGNGLRHVRVVLARRPAVHGNRHKLAIQHEGRVCFKALLDDVHSLNNGAAVRNLGAIVEFGHHSLEVRIIDELAR